MDMVSSHLEYGGVTSPLSCRHFIEQLVGSGDEHEQNQHVGGVELMAWRRWQRNAAPRGTSVAGGSASMTALSSVCKPTGGRLGSGGAWWQTKTGPICQIEFTFNKLALLSYIW